MSLIGPYLTGRMINEMTLNDNKLEINFENIFMLAGLMIAFYLVSATMNYFLSVALVKISQSVIHKLRTDLFDKMTKVSVNYFDTTQTGDIISRMSYDIDTISTTISADIMSLITSSITLIVSLVMMIIISIPLLGIYVITIPLSFIITTALSRVIKKRLRARNQQLGILNGYAEEMITAQKTIQSYVQEENVYKQFQQLNKDAEKKSYEAGYYSTTVGPSVNFINNFGTALVSTAGVILYLYSFITVGDLSSFMLYSKRFSGPINQLSNLVADIQSALAAAERIFYVLDQPDEVKDIPNALKEGINEGVIEFNDVSFGYKKDQPVLKNVSFKADKGQMIAIVGQTGAGKTTLVNLLMRYYEIDSGLITLDNEPIQNYQRDYYRKVFSMVLQDTWIFKGSVLDNIKYGNGDVTFDEVVEAAKKAKIHHYISHLPEGYHTILSDDGINISKGQKQLIVIARAMLSKSQILILDEATSNVDTYTEVNIQEAMKNLMKDKTSFVIAHRLSTIRNANLILLMQNGNIIEQGTHEELMDKRGSYYDLFMSQFS
ncbi:ABC-type multidrug/protein/lipid transport system ATPase component [Acholeplasma hippikon]|uniref:ABC-type multidrug/protein/lipid transport system ATPase component n=1 Tax=Acholeplasma hippikon TaxID=264636 RepID=A0A449BJG4_9MOLU|nr:ABC-type multidrug/protein/lipid transport system ATPase component [Acholeplasma hippikon]